MRKNLFIFFIFITHFVSANDPYSYIEDLIDQSKVPRILNIQDFPLISQNNLDPFITPQDDFDKNGSTDTLISGIFDLLPKEGNKYFLLVADSNKENRSRKIFYEESPFPYFIYLPGTTGHGDPGNQAFSISHCYNCETGLDYFWDKKNKTFIQKKWDRPQIQEAKITPKVEAEIAPEKIDQAIRLVSILTDVKAYADQLNKEGRKIGVSVILLDSNKEWYQVSIFEKIESDKKKLYDELTVDLKRNKILKRILNVSTLKKLNKSQE
ncbi:MAG: hypothetical protein ACKVQC_03050 [Elusimicrobiota bacterium]